MAGGSLTITANNYAQLPAMIQRVLCWVASANRFRVQTSSMSSVTSIIVPEEAFGAGALHLRRGGTNLVAGYIPGSHIVHNVSNTDVAVEQNPNTCPSSIPQPTMSSLTTNVGGNPLATTLTYANAAGLGTVHILWGDGAVTADAAESGTENHTYPLSGVYTITVVDATNPTDTALATFVVP